MKKPTKPTSAWAIVDETGDIRFVALKLIEARMFYEETPDTWRLVMVNVTEQEAKK